MEITSEEQNKVKRMKRTEESLRDLWDHVICTNIRIIEVSEEEAGEGNGNPLQHSCLENPRDGEAWWAACLWGHTESDTTEAT